MPEEPERVTLTFEVEITHYPHSYEPSPDEGLIEDAIYLAGVANRDRDNVRVRQL